MSSSSGDAHRRRPSDRPPGPSTISYDMLSPSSRAPPPLNKASPFPAAAARAPFPADVALQEVILHSLQAERRRRRKWLDNSDQQAGSSKDTDEVVITRVVTPIVLDDSDEAGGAVVDAEEARARDRKGKRKVDDEPNAQAGSSNFGNNRKQRKHKFTFLQCLNAIPVDGNFECVICMETVDMWKCFKMESCLHTFCIGCIRQYIAAKVEENQLSIKCPEPGCSESFLEPETCRSIIPSKLFSRWGNALCESALGSMRFYCPYRDCSMLLVNDELCEGNVIRDSECPHCRRMICVHCKVPWHHGLTCEDFEKLPDDEKGADDLLVRHMASDKNWQRCPNCKMYVERTTGCSVISCRCGICFCYHCSSPILPILHFCQNCSKQ